MKPHLMSYLVCPSCGQPFELEATIQDASDEVLEGSLHCRGCTRAFPIVRGIPKILPTALENAARETVAAFGWQWQKFDGSLQNTWFDSPELFLDFIAPVREPFFQGKIVLDAGCGRGRFARHAHAFGAREVIAIDLSRAVEVAYRHTRDLPNVHVVQTDIYNLPFPPIFDYIFSVGVLHHLPDPREGFRCLAARLNEGGSISIWVYGRENNGWLLTVADPIRRYVTSRLPSQALNALTHLLTIGLYPIVKLVYTPANRKETARTPKHSLFNSDYFAYLAQFDYATVHAVVFDHLTPRIAHYLPREELLQWFDTTEWSGVVVTPRTRNSWRGFGSRRSAALSGQACGRVSFQAPNPS